MPVLQARKTFSQRFAIIHETNRLGTGISEVDVLEVYITRVFIPRADNSGRPFSVRLFDQTELEVRKKFKGLTVWGEVQGQWVAPSGRLDVDAHRVYEIAHPGRERVWWEQFKEVLKMRFVQEEIWILQSSSGWKVL